MCAMRTVLACCLLALSGCYVAPAATPDPGHRLELVSLTCTDGRGRATADVTVRNIGTTTIELPSGTVDFGGSVGNSLFRPHPIRPGGVATMRAYAPGPVSGDKCTLLQIADHDGFAATVTRE